MIQHYSWQICRSKWLIRLLTLGYVLALIACFLNALTLTIKLILVTIIVLHSFFTLKKSMYENWQLEYDSKNGWHKLEFSGLREIKILPSTVLSRHFVFLHYQSEGKKSYRLIFKDALVANINDFRRLIVTLKTH
jgi:hypothetical protein